MNKSLMQLRPYETGDYPKLCVWSEAHGRTAPPEACLPPIGVVVFSTDGFIQDDKVFLFLYLAQGVGVCFLEHLVAKPRQTTSQTRAATVAAVTHLKALSRGMGYFLMIAHTVQGIARLMQHEGWAKADDTKLSAMFTTMQEATA